MAGRLAVDLDLPRTRADAALPAEADGACAGAHRAFLDLLDRAITQAVQETALRRERDRVERELRESRDRLEALAANQSLLLREVSDRFAISECERLAR